MESLDGDNQFVVDVNSGLFNFSISSILMDPDFSKDPEMESGDFSINLNSSVNLDLSNFLLDSDFPFSKNAINSTLTVIDDDGDGDLSFIVDSEGLI